MDERDDVLELVGLERLEDEVLVLDGIDGLKDEEEVGDGVIVVLLDGVKDWLEVVEVKLVAGFVEEEEMIEVEL